MSITAITSEGASIGTKALGMTQTQYEEEDVWLRQAKASNA
jgi:hypothetical protein